MMQISYLSKCLSCNSYENGILLAIFRFLSSLSHSMEISHQGELSLLCGLNYSIIYWSQHGFMCIYFIWWAMHQCHHYFCCCSNHLSFKNRGLSVQFFHTYGISYSILRASFLLAIIQFSRLTSCFPHGMESIPSPRKPVNDTFL